MVSDTLRRYYFIDDQDGEILAWTSFSDYKKAIRYRNEVWKDKLKVTIAVKVEEDDTE